MKKLFVFTLKIFAPLRLCVFAGILFFTSYAQTLAPGAPGKDAQWATAGKQGVGTSASLESKVWFTLAQGVMTEVYYPDVTMANVHLLQFVVVNPKTKKVETEQSDAIHTVTVKGYKEDELGVKIRGSENIDSLNFIQVNKARSGDWTIYKSYTVDVARNTVLINVLLASKVENLKFYVYYDPSLANSGMKDTAWNEGQTLFARDGETASALISDGVLSEISNGFYQTSDGLEQLRADGKITKPYGRAENGNVVQIAALEKAKSTAVKTPGGFSSFTFALGFGKNTNEAKQNASLSIAKGFNQVHEEYTKGWADYIKTLRKVEPQYQAQFNMAAMQLKAHEDKTIRGANIASLTVPWGGGENANENNIGGYHLIWSRDLYQVATAFMALGDREAAIRALNFLFKVQQKPDGSFPQNSFLDGKPFWGSLQLDEVAFPLILAHELGLNDKETYEKHVKKAADFIVRNGPKTPQERWEEEGGYSPSTIAAEIAGLVCAAEIARKNGDEASAVIYTATADDWARKVEMWTATTNGKYGDGNYYVRITQNGRPDAGEKIELNNGAGFFDEREIIDAGFLELVRLGIKPADDPLIAKSLKVVDEVIRVKTPNGDGFYRYNRDGYGEMDDGRRWNWDGKYTGKGRLWALLSGERGQYELALANSKFEIRNSKLENQIQNPKSKIQNQNEFLNQAKTRLSAMVNFANDGLMIPEQIWDRKETPNADRQFVPELKFGEGTGSATPLAWSMAQFIRLAVNLQDGRNLDTPAVVYNRYVKKGVPGQASNFGGMDETAVLPVRAGEKFSLTRRAAPNSKIAIAFQGATRLVPVNEKGEFTVEIVAPEKEETGIIAVEMPDGATAFERIKVRSIDKAEPQKFSAATIERIKNAKTSPLIENGKAILFYRGEAQSVMVAGDMTSWNPGRLFMQKIGENLHAVELDFVPSARAEYKLIVDGKWLTDELNPNKLDNGVGGENSILAMPEYKPTQWLEFPITGKSSDVKFAGFGKIEEFELNSTIYSAQKIKVYLPGNYNPQDKSKAFPVLYFQDGSEYLERAKAGKIQENLVEAEKIKPFIMVFLNPKNRTKEYWASDDYAKFVATEVVPAIDAKYNTIKTRDGRGIIGASLGGVTSVWVGLKYPEIFSKIGGQSSSFWIDNERVVKELAKLDANQTKFRFYFDDGAFEGTEDSRRVYVMLRGKGYPVTYLEGETGHNWTSWRDRLADAFVAFMN
jgi:glucan 1,4-alpha-glucosidase